MTWSGGTSSAPDIRIAAIGPDAPADPVASGTSPAPAATPTPPPPTKPLGQLTAAGSAKRRDRVVAVRLTLKLVLGGRLLRQGHRVPADARVAPRADQPPDCTETLKGTLKRSAVGTATSLKVEVRFGGNAALAASVQDMGSLRIR